MNEKLSFASDYMEGAHPAVMQRMLETNLERTSGYGTDDYCRAAKEKIRQACGCPQAQIHFLVGGTQTNATVITALLKPWQGVLASKAGHIATHEAGAIEAGGHKVMELPHSFGKVSVADIEASLIAYEQDENHEHMVMPGMVYLSQPTEYGTIYTKEELTAISRVCRSRGIPLYIDGARLAYALACPENDVTLKDLAKLCDVFYIGGTKCGALFGEAVVITVPELIPHFFTLIKQQGALLAKGRLLGLQFDALFTDGLYDAIGANGIAQADRMRRVFLENGYELYYGSPTNQVFVVLDDTQMEQLGRYLEFSFWERLDDRRCTVRFAAGWATTDGDVNRLEEVLKALKQ